MKRLNKIYAKMRKVIRTDENGQDYIDYEDDQAYVDEVEQNIELLKKFKDKVDNLIYDSDYQKAISFLNEYPPAVEAPITNECFVPIDEYVEKISEKLNKAIEQFESLK